MKKQTLENTSKLARNIFLPALLLTLLVTELSPVQAQAPTFATTYAKPVVKYLGKENNQLIFQMDFDNASDEYFNVAIKDEDGNLIYTDRFREKRFSKKFLVNQSEYGAMKLTFLVSTPNEKQAQVFTVNTNTRVVDDVVVTKL